jgi:hypothetical protein
MEGLKAGAGGSRRGSRHDSYHFTDPNELFRQFFGSTSIFDIMDEMMGARSHGGASRRNSNRRPDPFDPFVNGLKTFLYQFIILGWDDGRPIGRLFQRSFFQRPFWYTLRRRSSNNVNVIFRVFLDLSCIPELFF